ncbi:MAG: transposase [Chloroflexi bacterium]|nr:transposase [Chloroflexota bacterium]
MAYTYAKVSLADTQPPVVAELTAIFNVLPDEELLEALRSRNRLGRPGYDPKILWRCYLVRYLLGLPSVSALIRTLQDNPYIAHTCGVESPDQLPSQPTFSRFFSKLASWRYAHIVKNVSREMTRICYRTLPGFGTNVAIDSTHIDAWANKAKKPRTDPDATWSVKTSVGNLKKFWLGYKAHILTDASGYELPIAMVVTTANVHDSHAATRVLRQARVTNSKFHPTYVIADAGYSSIKLRKHIYRQYRAQPIIKAYKNDKRHLPLETPEWKLLYHRRVAVERVNSRLKGHRGLNHVTVKGIRKVSVHCFLSMIVLQSQALATHSRMSVRKVA